MEEMEEWFLFIMSKHIWSDKYQDYIDPDLKIKIELNSEKAKENFKICLQCSHFEKNMCKKCFCQMDEKVIALKLIDNFSCPLNKW